MIRVFFHGACHPNPKGLSTYGYAIEQKGDIVEIGSGIAQRGGYYSTINTANYHGAIAALHALSDYELGDELITVCCSRSLIVNQLSGLWAVKSDRLKPLHEAAMNILNGRVVTFCKVEPKDNLKAHEMAHNQWAKTAFGMREFGDE